MEEDDTVDSGLVQSWSKKEHYFILLSEMLTPSAIRCIKIAILIMINAFNKFKCWIQTLDYIE